MLPTTPTISKKARLSVVNLTSNVCIVPQFHCTVCCIFHSKFNFTPTYPLSDDLFRCLRYFLRFGKLFGIVPFEGVFQDDLSQLRFRWKSPAVLFSIAVLAILIVNVVIGFLGFVRLGGTNATDMAWSAESFIFYSMGVFTYIYFILWGKGLITVFHKWTKLSLEYPDVDMNLSRDVNCIAGFIYTSAILENLLLQVIFFCGKSGQPDDVLDMHPLERYYIKAQNHWSEFIPYHEALAILIFCSNKLALYAWNFVDVLIILMGRAMAYKYKVLHRIATERLASPITSQNPEHWRKVIKDHDTLCNLLKEFESFLSPLIFASYAINCFYICLQLHLGLTGNDSTSPLKRIYAIWSFVHLIARALLVSLSAAKINDHAHGILEVLYNCPESCESRDVERARFKISSKRIGLSGLGCFIITRPFILKIISVIFTFEIVLLQSPMSATCSPKVVLESTGR